MQRTFPSKEELMSMPLVRVRQLDIMNKEEEELVQEVVSSRLSVGPQVSIEVNLRVPDIKNGEEEAFWQKKIDDLRAKAREQVALQAAIPGALLQDAPETTATPEAPIASEPEKVEAPLATPVAVQKTRGRKTKTK